MLLAGHYAVDVAATIGVHPYTVSRWKSDPRFQAELRRQVAHAAARDEAAAQALQGAAPRNTAPQSATPPTPLPERTNPGKGVRGRYTDPLLAAILTGLPR